MKLQKVFNRLPTTHSLMGNFFVFTKFRIVVIFTIFLTFLIPFISKGQAGYEDVIYLKSGGIIYGTIIENVPDKDVTIKTDDGNVLTNNWRYIYKITKAQSGKPKRADTTFYPKGTRMSGFINITELNYGFTFYTNTNNFTAYGIRTINGYLIDPEFSIGAGVGYDNYNGNELSFLPIFADIRFYPIMKRKNTILVLDVGASPAISQDNNYLGGIMFSVSAGKRIHVSKKISINITIQYTYQNYTNYQHYSYPYTVWIPPSPPVLLYDNYTIVSPTKIDNLRLNFGMAFD